MLYLTKETAVFLIGELDRTHAIYRVLRNIHLPHLTRIRIDRLGGDMRDGITFPRTVTRVIWRVACSILHGISLVRLIGGASLAQGSDEFLDALDSMFQLRDVTGRKAD